MPDLTATPGTDGERVEALLSAAIAKGTALLRKLATEAVRRRLSRGQSLAGGALFDDREHLDLARHIASTTAAADLLGRQRIRRKLQSVAKFAETDSDWLQKLLTPRAALDWFRQFDPLKINDPAFEAEHEGRAFQIAVTTDQELLSRIFETINERIETGKAVRETPHIIGAILDDAGIEHNEGYGELVFRTSAMEAYRQGAWKEFESPDIADLMPVWKYLGVRDGRQRGADDPDGAKYPGRPNHRVHSGKYWPREVPFAQVRGTTIADIANCRCDWAGITAVEWKRLQAAGAVLEPPP